MSEVQSQDLALRQVTQSAVAQLQDDEFARQVQLAVPEGVLPRQLLRVAATAVLENPKLAAPNLRASLLQSTLKCAQAGLLPDGREAAFIVRKVKGVETVTFESMIGGQRKVAADHGWSILTAVVYENDGFDPDMDAHKTNHKPTPLGLDRGKPIGAYAIAEHRDGRRVGPEIYNVGDIEKVRNVSRAKSDGPWVDWWERMAEKTVGKRLFKKLALDPKDARIAAVLASLEEEDATDALYGPAAGEMRAIDGGPGEASPAAEMTSPSPTTREPVEGEIVDDDLNEPSEEELAAYGASQASLTDEVRFDRGRYSGKTLAEVYADGSNGRGYLSWALRAWPEGPVREALQQFAEQHPELRGTSE